MMNMDKELLYRFFERKTNQEENTHIRKWVESSSEHHKELIEERKLFDAMILLADEKRIRTHRFSFVNNKWIQEIAKIAAVITITLTAAFTYHFFDNEEQIAMQKLTVPAGQRINLELSDGTIVWLNSRSTIKYPASFKGDTRNVTLEGEAYFEVTKNKEKPFIVETSKGNIEVLGTKFNVEAYSDNESFTTSLMEGSVKVHSGNNLLLLKPDQMAFLKNGQLKISKIKDYNSYRWREGLICFKDETFGNIMKKFEKCYGVIIKIDNQKVLNLKYTGKFRQSDGISFALRVLQKDVMFKFERNEDNHIIYIK